MKKYIILSSLCLFSLAIYSQPRNKVQALTVAKDFFFNREGKREVGLSIVPAQNIQGAIRKVSSKVGLHPQSGCYIVNDTLNHRFVIVSADERMYDVLGYSEDGVFDADDCPPALMDMLCGYGEEYEMLMDGNVNADHRNKTISFPEIKNFMPTLWHQNPPYNNQCPKQPGTNQVCFTGCVATAMAQVMKYFKWPNKGVGQVAYTTETYSIKQSMDFSKVSFSWNDMPNSLTDNSSTKQKNAVALLMKACGISSLMDYGTDNSPQGGSAAYTLDMAYALINYFGYNPNLKYFKRRYFSDEEWNNIIIENLKKKLPVMYAGNNGEKGGHQFLITGCNGKGSYYINWGWRAGYNGYFKLSALTPNGRNYNHNQDMVCYISKEAISEYEDGIFASQFTVSDASVDKQVNAQLRGAYWINAKENSLNCRSYYQNSTYKGNICIGLFDLDYNLVKVLDKKMCQVDKYSSYFYFTIKYDKQTFKNGSQFYIIPYSESDEAPMSPIRTDGGQTNYYLAQVINGTVKVTPLGEPDTNMKPIFAPPIGTYQASSLNRENNVDEWKVSLTRDGTDTLKYWITNIDPIALENGCKNSENKIYGFLNKMGNIRIPTNLQLSSRLRLNNYSSSDSITVYVSESDSTMRIGDVWGIVGYDDDGNRTNLSQHSSTIFRYEKPVDDAVERPVIVVDDKSIMTISCPTTGADVYYTYSPNGSTPTSMSNAYNKPVKLTENGIIKAIAIKDGRMSGVAVDTVSSFTVAVPVITAKNNTITITCPTEGATIYYATDGDIPSPANGNLYSKSFYCGYSTSIKAIAVKDNWNNSQLADYDHIAVTEFEFAKLSAGQLPSKMNESDKLIATKLTLSGKLNGTDIKYIREMLQYGSLVDLDILNVDIVSGGEPYYYSGSNAIYTEDDYIDDYFFWRMNKLRTLILPKTTKRIGGIRDCSNLLELKVPNGCTEVGSISDNYSLKSIYLPKSVEELSLMVFWGEGCPNLKAIDVDKNNKTFKSDNGVLYKINSNTLLKYPQGKDGSYTVVNGTKTIGDYSFASSSVQKVILPTTVTTIEDDAFRECSQLVSIDLPASIKSIGSRAFQECTQLSEITLPDELVEIKYETFRDCKKMESITIGSKLSKFGTTSFDGMTSLKSFIVSDANEYFTSIDGVLYTKDLKSLLRYPEGKYSDDFYVLEGTEEIGDHGFKGCVLVNKIILPNTLSTIGENAFYGCEMESIDLPESVTRIEKKAFAKCSELRSLILPKDLAYLGASAILDCQNLQYIYLPLSIENMLWGNIANCPSLEIINSDIVDIESVAVQPIVSEGIIEYEAIGIFDDPSNPWIGLVDHPIKPTPCKWLVPYGCSERYTQCSWWRSIYTIEEKTANGDANANGGIDIADVVEMIDFTLDNQSDSFVYDVSDLNGDGVVDEEDVSSAISLVMTSRSPLDTKTNSNGTDAIYAINDGPFEKSIALRNNGTYIAAQMDIVTPADVKINKVEINPSRCSGHLLEYEQIDENVYRVIIYSLSNEPIAGNSDELFRVYTSDSMMDLSCRNVGFVNSERILCSVTDRTDVPTGITDAFADDKHVVFTLDGHRLIVDGSGVKELPKGIYIVDNKKFVVK